MKGGTILIKGKRYNYSFKQKQRRLFMEKNNLEYWEDYAEFLKSTEPHPTKGVSLKGQYVIADLVITAITAENPDFDAFDSDELLDMLVDDPKLMETLMGAFTKSQEQKPKVNKRGSSSSVPKSKGAK